MAGVAHGSSLGTGMDAETLRSLGIPESKIQELMNEDFELMEDFSDIEEEEEEQMEEIEDDDDLLLPMMEEDEEEEPQEDDDQELGFEEEVVEDDEDDSSQAYKSSDDWWRDPLAAFDEEDEDEDLDLEEPEESPSPIEPEEDLEPEEELIMEELSEAEPELEEEEEEEEEELMMDQLPKAEPELQEEEEESEAMEEEKPKKVAVKQEEENFIDDAKPQEFVENKKEIEKLSEGPIEAKTSKDTEKQLEVKQKVGSDIKTSISTPMAQAVSLLAPTVKSLISNIGPLATSNPLVQVVGAAAIARALMLSVGPKDRRKKKTSKQGSSNENDEFSALDEEFDAELEAYRGDEHAYSDEDEDYISLDDERDLMHQQHQHHGLHSSEQSLSSQNPRRRFKLPMGKIPNPFGGSRRLPSKHALLDEIEELKERVKIAEFERENVEKEYEETSMKLQETMTDLTSLQQTSKYLKAQLRDNEDALSRTVRAERRRAKEELKRMREAMLTVLERERKAMREKNEREIAELRSLMDDSEHDMMQS